MKKRGSGFTLVEILVVLAIIAILAALLFPAFNGAKENARQKTCQTNLQQISLAVKLYYQDERRYPDTLLDILAQDMKFNNGGATDSLGSNAPGYFKGGQDSLICLDDDSPNDIAHSSYGSLTKTPPTPTLPPPPAPVGTVAAPYTGDLSQYVWNYWGYRPDGFAYSTAAEAKAGTPVPAGGSPLVVAPKSSAGVDQGFLHPLAGDATTNVIKYSMANRFAPTSTIITHCIHHRLPTADNLNSAGELYLDPTNSKNARDIVLRIDGSAKPVDVAQWQAQNLWQNQTP